LRYPFVLLDVGGTLIGPQSSFGDVYSDVFSQFGLCCDGEDFNAAVYSAWDEMNREVPSGTNRYSHFEGGEDGYWRRFVTRSVEIACDQTIGENLANAALDELRTRFGKADAWRVFDDVPPALAALRNLGARLAVVSNWDSRLPDVLKVLELDAWFETVVVSHFEGVEKPDPELFRRALERLGADPGRTIHVGDSPDLDGEGARAAGVDFIWVDRRDEPAERTIPDFSALPRIVERGR
jgi:putative hydrolase of the HAD superfamily